MKLKLFFRELKDFFRFFFNQSKLKKQIVFYSEHGGYWPAFEGIIEDLTIHKKKSISYVTSDYKDPILLNSSDRVSVFYIKKLLPFFMLLVNCKVFVMTLTDLQQFHLKRSVNPVKYVYVFHALVSSHMMYREGAFDYYDTILCVGPHHEKEIRKREKDLKLNKKKLVYGGYYRLERIYNKYKNLNSKLEKRKHILIAPSWGQQNIIESCGIEVVKRLLGLGFKVTLRPHPETVRRSPELLAKYFDLFASDSKTLNVSSDFFLETSVSGDESMLSADLLITDLSGIALEYSFGTLRPVLFIDLPKKIQNKNYKILEMEPIELSLRPEIGKILNVDDLENLEVVVKQLINDKNYYKDKIESLRKENVFEFGNSSKVASKAILEYLKFGRNI